MAAKKKTPRQTYYVHNTSRDPKKKGQRLQQVGPDRSRLNIRIAGTMEVRRGRPLQVGDVILRRHLKELIELEEKGLVEVFDYRSQRVDLKKLEPAEPAIDPNKAKAAAAQERREASSLKPPPVPKKDEKKAPEPAPSLFDGAIELDGVSWSTTKVADVITLTSPDGSVELSFSEKAVLAAENAEEFVRARIAERLAEIEAAKPPEEPAEPPAPEPEPEPEPEPPAPEPEPAVEEAAGWEEPPAAPAQEEQPSAQEEEPSPEPQSRSGKSSRKKRRR